MMEDILHRIIPPLIIILAILAILVDKYHGNNHKIMFIIGFLLMMAGIILLLS